MSATPKISHLSIEGPLVLEPVLFADARGFFLEAYNEDVFSALGIKDRFVQDNHSFSKKGVLRGLHFQIPPKATSKLVRCIRGEVYDVIVDLRKDSPSFRKWEGITLSQENKKVLYVPRGFAHGFCVMSDEAEVMYKVEEYFAPECDRGVRWDDPDLAIKWPIDKPILSEKDAVLPPLKDSDFSWASSGSGE